MRIAYVSYEYPPDIAQGGIATYVKQVAGILNERGHGVEVFCASHVREGIYEENHIIVHRILCEDPTSFNSALVEVFSKRHCENPFDIIESPEIHGNAYFIKLKYPDLPMVVKFHMPLFLQMRLLNYYTPLFTKVRFFLGALRRGEIRFYGAYHFEEDVDYKITCSADACVSPSASLADILTKEWRLNTGKVSVIPYPFTPPAKLLNVPVVIRHTKVVSFIGKLNVHKGMVTLVDAIKKLIIKHPDVTFRLIGNDSYYTVSKMSMSDYIRKELSGYEKNFLIRGGLDYEEIMNELSLADVCVFPSIWENFPNVCLEAMSAGRAVVGSKNGGMSEMLSDGCGVIIDPLDSGEIAEEISVLLENPARRVAYGEKARAAILQRYNKERIGGLLEEHYEKVIADAC